MINMLRDDPALAPGRGYFGRRTVRDLPDRRDGPVGERAPGRVGVPHDDREIRGFHAEDRDSRRGVRAVTGVLLRENAETQDNSSIVTFLQGLDRKSVV